jgi:hypothetical protein
MKHIKDLTERDCIHCRTQEEFNEALAAIDRPNLYVTTKSWEVYGENTVLFMDGEYANISFAKEERYTIHPASDFLTPQVSVLTEIGDTKVIRHNDGCIVIKDDKAMTLSKDIVNWIKENL